jgi:hypothetical protein
MTLVSFPRDLGFLVTAFCLCGNTMRIWLLFGIFLSALSNAGAFPKGECFKGLLAYFATARYGEFGGAVFPNSVWKASQIDSGAKVLGLKRDPKVIKRGMGEELEFSTTQKSEEFGEIKSDLMVKVDTHTLEPQNITLTVQAKIEDDSIFGKNEINFHQSGSPHKTRFSQQEYDGNMLMARALDPQFFSIVETAIRAIKGHHGLVVYSVFPESSLDVGLAEGDILTTQKAKDLSAKIAALLGFGPEFSVEVHWNLAASSITVVSHDSSVKFTMKLQKRGKVFSDFVLTYSAIKDAQSTLMELKLFQFDPAQTTYRYFHFLTEQSEQLRSALTRLLCKWGHYEGEHTSKEIFVVDKLALGKSENFSDRLEFKMPVIIPKVFKVGNQTKKVVLVEPVGLNPDRDFRISLEGGGFVFLHKTQVLFSEFGQNLNIPVFKAVLLKKDWTELVNFDPDFYKYN